jgi:hypothetical protein
VNSKRFDDLAKRKQALITRAAHERAEVGVAYENCCASLNINQVLLSIGQTLKAHPLITAGISSVLVSGMAGKLLRGAAQTVALSRMALPLWSWWKSHRGSS